MSEENISLTNYHRLMKGFEYYKRAQDEVSRFNNIQPKSKRFINKELFKNTIYSTIFIDHIYDHMSENDGFATDYYETYRIRVTPKWLAFDNDKPNLNLTLFESSMTGSQLKKRYEEFSAKNKSEDKISGVQEDLVIVLEKVETMHKPEKNSNYSLSDKFPTKNVERFNNWNDFESAILKAMVNLDNHSLDSRISPDGTTKIYTMPNGDTKLKVVK